MDGPDTRRLGHAQRRRLGAPANVYADTLKPPAHGVGDSVTAPGRYGPQEIVGIIYNVIRPGGGSDGHGYVVQGGKGGRKTLHSSDNLSTYVSKEVL
jgi:hypothetical protein